MTDNITAARIVSDRPRIKTIKLEWPVEFNGKVYSEISISRLTVAEVANFAKSLEETKDDEATMLPMYFDSETQPIPKEVFDAMDQDDKDAIDQESISFLPRRFRGLTEPATTSKTGDTTEHTSEKN